jgi:hypothetical protein
VPCVVGFCSSLGVDKDTRVVLGVEISIYRSVSSTADRNRAPAVARRGDSRIAIRFEHELLIWTRSGRAATRRGESGRSSPDWIGFSAIRTAPHRDWIARQPSAVPGWREEKRTANGNRARGLEWEQEIRKKKMNENRSQGLFGNLSRGACCGGSVARGGKWLGLSSRRRPCAPPVTPRFLPAKAKDWERGYGFQERFYLSSLHGIKSS